MMLVALLPLWLPRDTAQSVHRMWFAFTSIVERATRDGISEVTFFAHHHHNCSHNKLRIVIARDLVILRVSQCAAALIIIHTYTKQFQLLEEQPHTYTQYTNTSEVERIYLYINSKYARFHWSLRRILLGDNSRDNTYYSMVVCMKSERKSTLLGPVSSHKRLLCCMTDYRAADDAPSINTCGKSVRVDNMLNARINWPFNCGSTFTLADNPNTFFVHHVCKPLTIEWVSIIYCTQRLVVVARKDHSPMNRLIAPFSPLLHPAACHT